MNFENPSALSDVLYQMSLAQDIPDATLVDRFVKRYPEFSDEIVAFAVQVAIDATESETGDARSEAIDDSQGLLRAMSRFQNALYAQRNETVSEKEATPAVGVALSITNPFEQMDAVEYQALAKRLNVNNAFLTKLRDRHIDPSTIPTKFQAQLSKEMLISEMSLKAHFHGPRNQRVSQQIYRADGNPTLSVQESFAVAVRNSRLSREQQAYLLSFNA